jgi:hypothetical protein
LAEPALSESKNNNGYRDPQLEDVNFQTVFHKQKTSWKVCR